MWFFNTIRGSKKWFCPAVTQKCDKCDRIAQYSFFFVTLSIEMRHSELIIYPSFYQEVTLHQNHLYKSKSRLK